MKIEESISGEIEKRKEHNIFVSNNMVVGRISKSQFTSALLLPLD